MERTVANHASRSSETSLVANGRRRCTLRFVRIAIRCKIGARRRRGDCVLRQHSRLGGHVMRRSTDRILTTHVGALPAPDDVWARLEVSRRRLRRGSRRGGRRCRRNAGVDFINEGELTKGGHWTQYLADPSRRVRACRERGGLGKLLMSSTDWVDFDEFYLAVLQNGHAVRAVGSAPARAGGGRGQHRLRRRLGGHRSRSTSPRRPPPARPRDRRC